LPSSTGPSGPSGPAGGSGPSGPSGADATAVHAVFFLLFLEFLGSVNIGYFSSSMVGSICSIKKIGNVGNIIINENGLTSGNWFMLKYSYSTPLTVNLSAPQSADGYSSTSRTYVLRGTTSIGSDSVWYVYYYKDPITTTNNLYLY
jgi:hypothetical protein